MDRLGLIRRRLDVDGRVRVVQLAGELDVSEMTIRRDLDVLVDEGVAHRVRGGAVAVGPQQFAARAEQHSRAKGRIADKLMELVGVGGAIGIDASSTLQRLAARLAPVRHLTVLTNGLDTFRSLQEHPGVTALLTGGELDESTGSLVGPLATRAAQDVMLRRLFVSASALDPELGIERVDVARRRGQVGTLRGGRRDRSVGRRLEARSPRPGALFRLRADRHPGHRIGSDRRPSRPVP